MAREDYMLNRARSTSVIFDRFIRKTNSDDYKNKKLIPVIVEGDEDFIFYSHKLEKILPSDIKLQKIIGYGCDKVEEFVKDINENYYYKNSHFLGFVDSDFNIGNVVYIIDDRLFILDKYSIENYYLTDSFFDKVLECYTNLDKDVDYSSLQNGELHFEEVWNFIQLEKSKKLENLKSYMICLKSIVDSDMRIEFPDPNIAYQDEKLKNLIDNNLNLDMSLFRQIFKFEDSLTQDFISKLLSSNEYFKQHIAEDAFRGKELLRISYKILVNLKGDFCGNKKRKLKFSRELSEKNFLYDFVTHTETPNNFENFIRNFEAKYL